jgi:hypothetical protein
VRVARGLVAAGRAPTPALRQLLGVIEQARHDARPGHFHAPAYLCLGVN